MSVWQTKSLGELIRLEYGKPLANQKRSPIGKYPVYGANGEKDRTNEFNFDKPSIIVGRKGSAGEINLTEEKFWALDVTYSVDYDEKALDLKFLYNLLTTLDLPKLAKGVKPGINRNEVYDIRVKVPPLPEQQRIAAILDQVFEGIAIAIANIEKNLANVREVFESELLTILSVKGNHWQRKQLGEIFKVGSSKRVLQSQWTKQGVPFYRGREVTRLASDGYVDNELFISEEHYVELAKKYGVPRAGDILITAIGTIGNTYIVKAGDRFYFKDASVLLLSKTSTISSEFVRYWLKSHLFFGQLDRGNGATVDTLTIQKLQSVKIDLPLLSEQENIVARLDGLSIETKHLEAIYQQKLIALYELKKSILNKAFSGQLH